MDWAFLTAHLQLSRKIEHAFEIGRKNIRTFLTKISSAAGTLLQVPYFCLFKTILNNVRLSELRTGQVAVIKSLGDHPISNKLLEMGCLPGELLRVRRIAPFGDPMAIEILGYELAMRLDEAEAIEVEVRPNFVQL